MDGNDIADVYPYLKGFRRAMINPEVLEESEETADYSEGCLSVPDIHCNVVRPKKMKVRYYDPDLNVVEEELRRFCLPDGAHEMTIWTDICSWTVWLPQEENGNGQAAQHRQGKGPYRIQDKTGKINAYRQNLYGSISRIRHQGTLGS